MFFSVFHCLPPFYAQEWIMPIALCSSLLTKEQPWANRSYHSLQKSNLKWFALVVYDKRATGAIRSFHEQITLSLTKNKQFAQKNNEWIRNPCIAVLELKVHKFAEEQRKKSKKSVVTFIGKLDF